MTKISKIKLRKTFGPYVFRVLGDRLQYVSKGWYEAAALPTVEEYKKLEKDTFSTRVADAVENAKSELESLRDELQDWYDNLPESFQNGDKGDQLQEAVSQLETAIDNIQDVPDCLDEVKVFIRPLATDSPSRADRGGQAAYELRQVSEHLEGEGFMPEGKTLDEEQQDEVKEFQETLASAADDADSVEYPGMY